MLEGGRVILMVLGQGNPCLDAKQARRPLARRFRRAFGMRDTAPGDHPVERAGLDDLIGAGAVAVMEAAAIETGDRAQPDMRMRAHIHPLPGQELGRTGLIEEDERPHHLPLGCRQGAAHLEAAKVASAGHDQGFDRVNRGMAGATGVKGWVPACRGHSSLAVASVWKGGFARKPFPFGKSEHGFRAGSLWAGAALCLSARGSVVTAKQEQ